MLYDKLITTILEESSSPTSTQPSFTPGSTADYYNELKKRGYSIKPRVADDTISSLYNHDPTNPKTPIAVAQDKIDTALIRLGQGFFALGSFINQMKWVPNDPRVATAAVDQSGNFYYNSDFINALTIGQIAGLIMHELAHIGMGDLFRAEDLDHKRWNIASDYMNNWYIINDLDAVNNSNESDARKVLISLPPGGLFPDDDGIIRRITLSQTEDLYFPEKKQIDLNSRSTEEVYEMLKDLDDTIIDILDDERFDSHINQVSINAVEIEEVLTGGGGGDGGKGPIIGADLSNVLIIDKRTNAVAVVVKDTETNKTVSIVQISAEAFESIRREFDLGNLPIS